MAARSLTERIEILEQKVGDLRELPGRMAAVESQILQLRGEIRDGFSAIHARLGTHDQRFESIDQRFESIDQRFESIDQRFDDLTRQMREGHQEIGRHMRLLHEDVLARLAATREAPPPGNGRGRRKR